MIIRRVRGFYTRYKKQQAVVTYQSRRENYLKNGQIPWSEGYQEYKLEQIQKSIHDKNIIDAFAQKKLPEGYGYRLDERLVEYPWAFSVLKNTSGRFLDAGSTFNYEYLLDHPLIQQKDTYIYTFHPEQHNFNSKKVSYLYGDLRDIPVRDSFFDEIACLSTLEHIDMDNAVYGYEVENNAQTEEKSYEFLIAIKELLRVLKPGGTLLISFPFGTYEKHGYFQQMDSEMVARALEVLKEQASAELTFFKYVPKGWIVCKQEECENVKNYNPNTGRGKGEDGAAHSRGICCIKAIKNL